MKFKIETLTRSGYFGICETCGEHISGMPVTYKIMRIINYHADHGNLHENCSIPIKLRTDEVVEKESQPQELGRL